MSFRPRPSLLRTTTRKARQDGARMVLSVPLAVTSPHWRKLIRASIIQGQEPCIRTRSPELKDAAGFAPREPALLLREYGPRRRRRRRRPASRSRLDLGLRPKISAKQNRLPFLAVGRAALLARPVCPGLPVRALRGAVAQEGRRVPVRDVVRFGAASSPRLAPSWRPALRRCGGKYSPLQT